MAKQGIRIDPKGGCEGHGDDTQSGAEKLVKKGKFMEVGTSVPLATEAYSPNRKTGTANGATGGAE